MTTPGRGEVIANRPTERARPRRKRLRRSGFTAGTAVPRRRCLPTAIETERSVVTTQISELGRAQRRRPAVALVSDRRAATTVEPVPRMPLRQQEACASLGRSEEFFVEHVRPHFRVAGADGKRPLVKQVSTAESATPPGNLVRYESGSRAIGRSSQRTSPAVRPALSFATEEVPGVPRRLVFFGLSRSGSVRVSSHA